MSELLARAGRLYGHLSLTNPGQTLAHVKGVVNRRRYALTPEQRSSWESAGYIVLPRFFSPERMRQARAGLDDLWRDRTETPLVIDVFGEPADDGVASNGRRVAFAAVDGAARREVYKLNDVYLERQWVRELSLDPRLAAVISQLLNDDPVVVNSLIFERGSTQPLHFDTYYMPGRTPGGMTATWIALEDGHIDAGPLTYVPGSHRMPPWRNSDGLTTVRSAEEQRQATWYAEAAVRDHGLTATTFVAREGDVFIWHEQLYHGGGRIIDNTRTRRSLVTHYWRVKEADPEHEVVRHSHGSGFYYRRGHPTANLPTP